jgi:antitoxin PrlF
MLQSQSKLTSQGQVSVPAAIRQALALTPGSTLVWMQEGGRVTVQRATRHSTAEVHTALFDGEAAEAAPKTLTQLKQGIREHIKSRHARS